MKTRIEPAYKLRARRKIRGVQRKKKRVTMKSLTKLKKELDGVFSKYVRTKVADSEGMVQCYTCPQRSLITKIHTGHYISRYYTATRWDENNTRPQCMMCNLWKKGNSVLFRMNLVKELGEKMVSEMEQKSVALVKRGELERDYLTNIIEKYTQKLKDLLALDGKHDILSGQYEEDPKV